MTTKRKANRRGEHLTPKQAKFVKAYLANGFNGAQAAIAAGYSRKTAKEIATENLTKPHIAKAIGEVQARELQKLDVTADRVRQEMARIAFSDVRQAFDEHGNLRMPHELPDDTARAIAGVEVVTRRRTGEEKTVEEVHKVKFWDKTKVLADLARTLGMLNDHQPADVTVTVTIVDARARLAAAMARALRLPAADGAESVDG